jgi:hypothetical protein
LRKINWHLPISSQINCQFYDSNEEIFLAGSDGHTFSFNPLTQNFNWESKFDGKAEKLINFDDNLLLITVKPGNKVELNYINKANGKEIWKYTPDILVSSNNIYNEGNKVYFLDKEKRLIEKIEITKVDPAKKNFKKINFKLNKNTHQENFNKVLNNNNQYLNYEKKDPVSWIIKKSFIHLKYIAKNLQNIFLFKINHRINQQNIFEITIKHDENLYKNKFTNIKIEATFSQENKSDQITVRGYYYDQNEWKINFSAPEKAKYRYQLKITSPFIIKKIKGEIELDNSQQNKISVKEGFFVINNEEAFFPIGIQDVFVDRNYNGNLLDMMPNSSTIEPTNSINQASYIDIDNYLDLYKNQAELNIFRYGVDHWTPALWQSLHPQHVSFNVKGGKFGDLLVEKLKERDYKIIMTIFGFYPPYKNKEEIKKQTNQKALEEYLDYVIARYSAYIDLWELSNEAEANPLWYKFITKYIKENDPYQHPISTNWETSSAKNLDFLSVHWYNPDSIDPGFLSNQIAYLNQNYRDPNRPILISELGFKNYSHFPGSSESMRIISWLSIFQKMGIIFWTQGQNGIYTNPDNANIYLGPIERSYLLAIHDFLPKNLLLPIENEFLLIPSLQTQVYLLKNNDFLLAYLLKIDKPLENEGYLNLDLKKQANLQWINPKTGVVIKKELIEKGKQTILVPNFAVDLAMKITYIE